MYCLKINSQFSWFQGYSRERNLATLEKYKIRKKGRKRCISSSDVVSYRSSVKQRISRQEKLDDAFRRPCFPGQRRLVGPREGHWEVLQDVRPPPRRRHQERIRLRGIRRRQVRTYPLNWGQSPKTVKFFCASNLSCPMPCDFFCEKCGIIRILREHGRIGIV